MPPVERHRPTPSTLISPPPPTSGRLHVPPLSRNHYLCFTHVGVWCGTAPHSQPSRTELAGSCNPRPSKPQTLPLSQPSTQTHRPLKPRIETLTPNPCTLQGPLSPPQEDGANATPQTPTAIERTRQKYDSQGQNPGQILALAGAIFQAKGQKNV